VHGVLRDAANAVSNGRTAGHAGSVMYAAYLKTASQQHRMLASVLSPSDLDRLLTTPRYWMLHSLDPIERADSLAWLLDVEVDEKARLLTEAAKELGDDMHQFSVTDAIIVPDTNVLLHHENTIEEIPWIALAPEGAEKIMVAIPMLVVDELDRAKRRPEPSDRGKTSVRTRARQTLRTLEEWFEDGRSHHRVVSEKHEIEFTVAVDDAQRTRLADPDFEIIDAARAIGDLSGKPTVIATSDTAMRFRARAAGVTARAMDVVTARG
jgi:rRNA-processing protein FCF1